MCSLHPVLNVLPVCRMHFHGQSRHLNAASVAAICLCCVLCAESYFDFSDLEQFCVLCYLFAVVCKRNTSCSLLRGIFAIYFVESCGSFCLDTVVLIVSKHAIDGV